VNAEIPSAASAVDHHADDVELDSRDENDGAAVLEASSRHPTANTHVTNESANISDGTVESPDISRMEQFKYSSRSFRLPLPLS
jgi:hypothetical protein